MNTKRTPGMNETGELTDEEMDVVNGGALADYFNDGYAIDSVCIQTGGGAGAGQPTKPHVAGPHSSSSTHR